MLTFWLVLKVKAEVLFVKKVRGVFVVVLILFWSSLNVCAPAAPCNNKAASPEAGSTVIVEPVVEIVPAKVALPPVSKDSLTCGAEPSNIRKVPL